MEISFEEKINELISMGQNREAIRLCQQTSSHAVSLAAGVYCNRLGDRPAAIALLRHAVEIDPKNPVLRSSLGSLLIEENKLEEALVLLEKGTKLQNPPADLFFNYGKALAKAGKMEEAVPMLVKARDLNPTCALTRFSLCNVLLALGKFGEGLKEQEFRFHAVHALKAFRRRYSAPDWKGQDNQTVLVFNEQGAGDCIMYARYLPHLRRRNCKIILEVATTLVRLMVQSGFADEVIAYEEPPKQLPKHDSVLSMTSLPLFFDPDLTNIPLKDAYLQFEASGAESGLSLLEHYNDRLKVGLAWAGNEHHEQDKYRSIFLKEFHRLANLSDVRLFSFQQGSMQRSWPVGQSSLLDGGADYEVVNLLEGSEGIEYIDLAHHAIDWNDTARLLSKIDLLISADTAVAHLAGAIGIPVWLLLPKNQDWRWRRHWYPSMKVFRQKEDWHSVIEEIALALRQKIDTVILWRNHSGIILAGKPIQWFRRF